MLQEEYMDKVQRTVADLISWQLQGQQKWQQQQQQQQQQQYG